MSVDIDAIVGVGLELTYDDIKLLGEYKSFTNYVFDNELDDEIIDAKENTVCVVNDPYDGAYEYLMHVLMNRGEYDDSKYLSIDIDLNKFAKAVCEKYKELFGTELDKSRIKLISFLRYT